MASEVKHPESIKNPKEASLEIDIRDKQIYREKIYRQILLAVMRNNYDGAVDNNYYLFRGDKVLCKSGLMSTSKEGIIIEDSSLKPNVEYRIQYTDGTRNYINIHNIKKILSNFQSSLDNVIKMEKLSMPTSEPTPYTVLVKYNNLEALFKGTKDILFGSLTDILKNHIDTTSLPINCSLLMVAATIPDIDPRMVDYIISHGADINYALTSGKTALIIAAENGNLYTVKQLLSPYIQTRANILEEDPDSIDLKSLTKVAQNPKGLMGLYDYEISLRSDPKWRYTKNAQDNMSKLSRGIAEMFGLVG